MLRLDKDRNLVHRAAQRFCHSFALVTDAECVPCSYVMRQLGIEQARDVFVQAWQTGAAYRSCPGVSLGGRGNLGHR